MPPVKMMVRALPRFLRARDNHQLTDPLTVRPRHSETARHTGDISTPVTEQVSLLALAVVATLVAYAGWYATPSWTVFYTALAKPDWAIEAPVFTIVWVCMSVLITTGTWSAVRGRD